MVDKVAPPRRFRSIRKQVSAFLLTAFLGFAGLVLLVAYKQGAFIEHTNIYFHAPDATGISTGMAVRLHGVPVGQVRDIQFADRGVRVRLGINKEHISRLPRGAQARLTREGYVGATSIQILPVLGPTADPTPVAEGDEIRFLAQKSMADMLDEVRQQLTPAFQELRQVAAEMADPQSDFRRSVASVRELVEELPPTAREMRQLMRDTDRTILAMGKRMETTLASVERVANRTDEHLPLLTGKLATTLDTLEATAKQVQETTRTNGEALREILASTPQLVRDGGELVRDTQELTAAARRTWLLRDYIEAPQMRTLPVDSFESFGKR